jgi:hypothetical protein
MLLAGALTTLALMATASTAGASTFTCNGTFTGGTYDSVSVPSNGSCTLIDATVAGSVTVKPKAYFEADSTDVGGRIYGLLAQTVYIHDGSILGGGISTVGTAQVLAFDSSVTDGSIRVLLTSPSGGQVNVCGMTVSQDVTVLFSGTDILIGDPLAVDCAGNNVGRDIDVVANHVTIELVVRGNTVGDDLHVNFNRGPAGKFVESNIGGDELDCRHNSLPFSAAANVGWNELEGQCAGP